MVIINKRKFVEAMLWACALILILFIVGIQYGIKRGRALQSEESAAAYQLLDQENVLLRTELRELDKKYIESRQELRGLMLKKKGGAVR